MPARGLVVVLLCSFVAGAVACGAPAVEAESTGTDELPARPKPREPTDGTLTPAPEPDAGAVTP